MLGATALALGAALIFAWLIPPAGSAGPCEVARRPASLPGISEASGLAVSRRTPSLLWSHNDSGNDTVLFAIDPGGAVRRTVRVRARTRDWEDISAGPCDAGDCLYIADIGDNRAGRQHVAIYRLPEPAPGETDVTPPDVFDATYADGAHNAEAMFVIGTDLFIVTKDRAAGVYRAGVPSSGGGHVRFAPVGQLGLPAVTDAETSRDGSTVVVRTSHEAVLYRAADVLSGRFNPVMRRPLDPLREAQGEGVALDGETLYLASEGRPWTDGGMLLTLRCTFSN